MTSTKILRIKNSILIALAAAYYIFCKIVSRPLLTFSDTHWAQPREAGAYIKSNLVYVAVFVLFMSFAVTSFLLAYLIYCRFDRNRAAARTAIRGGIFFLCFGMYVIAGTNALDVFSGHVRTIDYLGCIAMLISGLSFTAFLSTVCNKKWLAVADWLFTAATAELLVLNLTGAPAFWMQQMLGVVNIALIGMLLFCTLLQIRFYVLKKSTTKVLSLVLGCLEAACLIAALVCLFVRELRLYWVFFSVAVIVMAILEFGELVNMAARQYINSASDAEKYRKMAYVDALCNISNRNAFVLEQNETFDSDSLYYVVFDVNNLKRINDRFGHVEGDAIIQKAALFIYESFKGIGKCYRIGGDEFAVIGKYKTADEIKECLRQMKHEIEDYNRTSSVKLDLAFGYAIRDNREINTYELFNKADREMYRYKRRSKQGYSAAAV